MPDISVLTICAGRRTHLENVIRGLARQSHQPAELVIGVMQEDLYDDLPDTAFPIRQVRVPPKGGALPLARARNAVAEAARGDLLIFLDVDCIPHHALVADYAAASKDARGLFMGEVLYLPAGATDNGLDETRFDTVAQQHSERRGPPETGLDPCRDYRCFWSLNFALHAADWAASGGFDERFTGYGGEDTDFGRSLDARDIPIWWTAGARVYHQYHPHCMPPIHHVASVVHNAEVFADKWGHRTMEHWLRAFRLMGLIREGAQGLEVVRQPTEEEFALCRQQEHQPFASSATILDQLEQRARQAPGRAGQTPVTTTTTPNATLAARTPEEQDA